MPPAARVWIAAMAVLFAASCGRRALSYGRRPSLLAPPQGREPWLAQSRRSQDAAPRSAWLRASWRRTGVPPAEWGSGGPPGWVARQVAGPIAVRLRALVGQRDNQSSSARFALRALAELGAILDPELAAVAGEPDLRELAAARDALAGQEPPLPGDLLLFSQVRATDPGSLLGVVVGTDPRGTIEFVYLQGGIVRRGFLNHLAPRSKRDDRGRVLNTILRQRDGTSREGLDDLASALFAATIRLERLLLAGSAR